MDDIILMARAAKKRMKTNFWADCKKNMDESALKAKINGFMRLFNYSTWNSYKASSFSLRYFFNAARYFRLHNKRRSGASVADSCNNLYKQGCGWNKGAPFKHARRGRKQMGVHDSFYVRKNSPPVCRTCGYKAEFFDLFRNRARKRNKKIFSGTALFDFKWLL